MKKLGFKYSPVIKNNKIIPTLIVPRDLHKEDKEAIKKMYEMGRRGAWEEVTKRLEERLESNKKKKSFITNILKLFKE